MWGIKLFNKPVATEERKFPLTYGGVKESSYTLATVQSWFSSLFNTSGQSVTAESSMKSSSYYACIRNISEDIAKVPFEVYRIDEKGNKIFTYHNASRLLNKMPSSMSTPFTFKQTMQEFVLRFGNAYAYIERDYNGIPINLYVLDSQTVTVEVVDQRLFYIVNDIKSGIYGTFFENDIFHIRGMGDGYVGKSILQYGAESIGLNLALQTYSASFFGNGATLSGTLEVPGVIQDENQAKSIVNTFKKSYKSENGSNNGIGLLHSGAKFSKIAATPNEGQMVEAKAVSTEDILRWFRMPKSKAQTGTTGSDNLEQLNIEYVTDCLMPWFVRWEQETERKLFRYDEMDKLDAKFNVAMLMRGDSKSTAEYLKSLKLSGFISSNDGRRFIGMNTIDQPYADKIYSPANMIPSDIEEGFWAAKDNSQATSKQPGNGGEN